VTALQFAQLTRDAWRTRVFDLGPRHWLLVNDGHLRTFRLPSDAGVPDMVASKGVRGWTEHAGSLYIHTNGQPRTELVLTDAKPQPPAPADAHVYLAASEAEIQFEELSAWKVDFKTTGMTDSQIEFAGLPAKTLCEVIINDQPSTVAADEKGHVHFSLPPNSHVILDASRSRYASLR